VIPDISSLLPVLQDILDADANATDAIMMSQAVLVPETPEKVVPGAGKRSGDSTILRQPSSNAMTRSDEDVWALASRKTQSVHSSIIKALEEKQSSQIDAASNALSRESVPAPLFCAPIIKKTRENSTSQIGTLSNPPSGSTNASPVPIDSPPVLISAPPVQGHPPRSEGSQPGQKIAKTGRNSEEARKEERYKEYWDARRDEAMKRPRDRSSIDASSAFRRLPGTVLPTQHKRSKPSHPAAASGAPNDVKQGQEQTPLLQRKRWETGPQQASGYRLDYTGSGREEGADAIPNRVAKVRDIQVHKGPTLNSGLSAHNRGRVFQEAANDVRPTSVRRLVKAHRFSDSPFANPRRNPPAPSAKPYIHDLTDIDDLPGHGQTLPKRFRGDSENSKENPIDLSLIDD
jgi:hypothetical protein